MTVPLTGDPLLAAKLAVPCHAPGLVRRPRLLNRLTLGTRGPLTLITGAPGVGKTALAASWARSASAADPVVWVTVDEDDTPGVFWAYVVEGLRRSGALAGDDLGTPVCADEVDRSLLVRLAAALELAPAPLVLVVDGLDKARGGAVPDGLRFVSEHAGPALRLVLVSREDPPLPLHRYRAEDRVHEIREHDLAFTRSEAVQLLRGQGAAPDDELVDVLLEHTEGWAAGLRLCALAMARSDDPAAFARSFTASEQAVSDYLLTEVLAAQPEPARELLLRTGVLNRVHPDLAAALTGRSDSGRILQDLARCHAFVEPLPGTRWYRFHPLFAEVLRAHLRSRQPELEPLLHRRAARWYAGQGRSAEAVEEAAAGGDWSFAAAQTVQHLLVIPLLAGSGTSPSADDFSRMPEDVPGTRAALVAAACCMARQDVAGCRSRLERAEEAPGATALEAEPADGLTAALLRLLSAPGAADDQARRVAELLARVPPEERARHPELEPLRLYGQACARLRGGRLQPARELLEQAAGACCGDTAVLLRHRCLGRLALADAAAGELARAEEHGAASLALADQHGIPDSHRSGAAGLALAAVALEREELAAAAGHLDQADLLADTRRDPDLVIERAVLRAQLQIARGGWEAALTHLDGHLDGTAAASPGPAARLAVAHATAALARGDVDAAAAALDRVRPDDAPPSHTVALAQVRAAADHPVQALQLIETAEESEAVTVPDRVRLLLLRAHQALLDGHEDTARDLLVQALDTARPEGLRRPFTEAGPWVRHLVRGLDGRSGSAAWLGTPHAPADRPVVEELSPREREVLRQVARMMSTDEVAAELQLSVNTVKTHLRGIYRKLCVSRRRDAVERARELHML
ncbi:LuxR C-terminal-related transcriptional regulator [Streptomyces racemochromogenes]|uniref:LuxR C-terminal-related transcriptional regulator n=1 Tax=Streptomyces racemochromogenes TaxID=67353 RepID=A0ABW7PCB5_9ACTN